MAEIIFTAGTYTIEDDGIPGNNVVVIRDSEGAIVDTVDISGDSELVLLAGEEGVNFILNLGDALGDRDLTVGNLEDSEENPDSIVVLTAETSGQVSLASNGTVTEGDADAGADIVAGSLIISAGEGIGSAEGAIETQVSQLEAESETGDVVLTNFGSVTIGDLTSAVDGLRVEESGDVILTVYGSVYTDDYLSSSENYSYAVIEAGTQSGDVRITTIGGNADFVGVNDEDSVFASNGDVVLDIGGSVILGSVDGDNDIRAGDGSVFIEAGGDIVANDDSDIAAGDGNLTISAGGDLLAGQVDGGIDITAGDGIVSVTVGGDVVLDNDSEIGGDGSVTVTAGGDIRLLATDDDGSEIYSKYSSVVITTGAGGTFEANSGIPEYSGSYGSYGPYAAVSGTSVAINADGLILGKYSVEAETVTISTVTETAGVNLGTELDVGFGIGLSDDEIDSIETDDLTIQTGGGRVTISSAVSFDSEQVTLSAGEDIRINADVEAEEFLQLQAGGNVLQTSGTITADTLEVAVDSPDNDANGQFSAFVGGANTNSSLILGSAGVDTLGGTTDDDTLNGGGGADALAGAGGDDVYLLDNAGDTVTEAEGEGFDLVYTVGSYTLAAGSEVEVLSSIAWEGAGALDLTGNEFANLIFGNAGANVLNGGGGADNLNGFGGDDVYIVDNAGDLVAEAVGEGYDLVYAAASYELGAGVEVEALSAISWEGTAALNLTGNEFANLIFGNAGANVLNGDGGADNLNGFGGDDVYFVDNAGDTVAEAASGGFDLVYTSISYTLSAQIEAISTVSWEGTGAIDLTGNAQANLIFGNAGANVLNGGAGADSLNGFGGADSFAFTSALGGGNVDSIADFSVADDTILLDDAVFTGLATGALPANAFAIGSAAAEADDRIIYDSATGALYFDADGSGSGAAVQFATLSSGLSLTASDFAVI